MSFFALIERRMNTSLIAGCALGLLWPYWQWVPDKTVLALIMGATFIACFRLNPREFARVPWKLAGRFYIARFLLLPMVIYMAAWPIFGPQIALGLLLVSALPVGASAPAMTHVFDGHVALTAVLTLLSTLLTPLVLPLMISIGESVPAGPSGAMFRTLFVALLMPCVLFLYVRRYPLCHRVAERYGRGATILMISTMIAIVVGKLRVEILHAPVFVLEMFVVTLALLALLLAIGWWSGNKLPKDQQVALATASGFNNIGLGVGMALLHFSATVALVAIVCEIAWAFLPLVMRYLKKE